MPSPTQPYDPAFYVSPTRIAAQGYCSQHGRDSAGRGTCDGTPVASYLDRHGQRQSGCARAVQQLVARGEIEALD